MTEFEMAYGYVDIALECARDGTWCARVDLPGQSHTSWGTKDEVTQRARAFLASRDPTPTPSSEPV